MADVLFAERHSYLSLMESIQAFIVQSVIGGKENSLMKKHFTSPYTTQEQATELTALGIPAHTADSSFIMGGKNGGKPKILLDGHDHYLVSTGRAKPCWSATRLMEIYEIATCSTFFRDPTTPMLEDVIAAIREFIQEDSFDFAVLEEYTWKS